VVVPQRRAFPIHTGHVGRPVEITEVNVGVVILEQVATTTMDISLRNPASRRAEAELLVPVPDGAVVRGFAFQGAAQEPTAQLLPKDEARRIYNSIVAKVRDPALLEFAGYNLVRSCVFPIEPQGDQKVRLTYEHVLPTDGDRVDYVLPRSEAVDYNVKWNVAVRIKSKRTIATVYSPSHTIDTQAGPDRHETAVRIAAAATAEPGPFRLSYLLERNGVSASLFAYPDPKVGGGYFLMLAGAPKPQRPEGPGIRREVTLVLDRSGSMSGGKLEQVRAAALQILEGLDDGEAFNVIVYNESVELFAAQPVLKSRKTIEAARKYLDGVQPRGGTNIHDALLEGLRQKPTAGMLPIMLFLTDGLPTIGQTSERAIRDVATKVNLHHRRIFTFGVGLDVNSPLLENLAYETRGTATFVLPNENVELKVAGVFKRLSGPVLADPVLRVLDGDGVAAGRVRDLLPARLPDLFEGDQLVLLGQYVGEEPLAVQLAGSYLGEAKRFKFNFDLDKATTRNSFVPRLWASRKIGVLIDAIRSSGADVSGRPGSPPAAADPKIKELVDEIVRLSTEFGILTEYTAFLAREGMDLSKKNEVLAEAREQFYQRAVQSRSGLSSINQDLNSINQKSVQCTNLRNSFWDANLNRVEISTVQQVCDRAMYYKSGRWVDSRIVEQEAHVKPARIVEFGSDEYFDLAARLATEGRQGLISLRGDTLMVVDEQPVLVKAPAGK
jgi:Ca-activated chloride channel family protein